jgi:diguanylate cyclase (GGDEF)-like protein
MRRRSLTTTFAGISLLAVTGLAVVLGSAVDSVLRQQALAASVATAEAYVGAGIAGHVQRSLFDTTADDAPAQKAALDTFVRQNCLRAASAGSGGLLSVRLWSGRGHLVYDGMPGGDMRGGDMPGGDVASGDMAPASMSASSGSAAAQESMPMADPGQLGRAVGGSDAAASVREETVSLMDGKPASTRTVLDVYVPVRVNGSGPVVGVAEMTLDYAATSRSLGAAVRTIAVIIVAGLVILWLLLFRTVHRASRRLRQTSADNARLALLDPLTGLANRRLLADRMAVAAERARSGEARLALLLLDLDRFKEINDTLGHDRGDELLVQVADRLSAQVRDGDTVARLGGDEFAVLLPGVESVDDAEAVAGRVLEAFAQPFHLADLTLHIEASSGLALMPDHTLEEITLLRRADVALYASKASRQGLSTFVEDGVDRSTSRLVLQSELRAAMDRDDQLHMYYQPKVDLATGARVGFEALVRWQHPVRGLVMPSEFVPIAESSGMMRALTTKVLRMVCAQVAAWGEGGWNLPVAVNLSACNLAETDLAERIGAVLEEFGVPPHLLQLEITESAIVADPARAAAVLRGIAALGATVALDDFGVGNTSLSQLRDLPIQTLKIDRSFVSSLRPGSDAILKVITDLGHEFGLVVVAEGIEDGHTAMRLRRLGCDVAQGFFYSHPVPADQLTASLGIALPQGRAAGRRDLPQLSVGVGGTVD